MNPSICGDCRARIIGKCQSCERNRQRKTNANRTADTSFYKSQTWQRLRKRILIRDPFCMDPHNINCKNISEHVDHIKARELGGSDNESNLQGLCKPCHSRKTVMQDGGFRGKKHNA